MKMERAMPAMADHFARGFKVCGLVWTGLDWFGLAWIWRGGREIVDVVGVVGVVRSRNLLKRDEGVEEEMIRKCAVVSTVSRVE